MPYFEDLIGMGTLVDGGGRSAKDGVVVAFVYRSLNVSTRFRFTYAGVTFARAVEALVPNADRIIRSFASEAELRMGWTKLAEELRRARKQVIAGALMSHASNKPIRPNSTNVGIEARPVAGGSSDNDGTLTPREISALPRLPWNSRGFLVLGGCHTGEPVQGDKLSVADYFARQQGVPAIGQRGSGSFSKTWDSFRAHDSGDTTETVLLWSYNRGLSNNVLGDGARNQGSVSRLTS
jgi:hypothetical protein